MTEQIRKKIDKKFVIKLEKYNLNSYVKAVKELSKEEYDYFVYYRKILQREHNL